MKPAACLATAAALAAAAATAAAQDYPDLVGVWTGTSEAVVIGDPPHYMASEEATPTVGSADFTLMLTGQDGRRIWGTFGSEGDIEPWLGVLWSDGKGLMGVDGDGYVEGRILDPDTMEFCYTHTGQSMVASCVRLTRE